jgi:hypothetical protein
MKASPHTLKAIATLEAHYGRRFFFEARHLPIWQDALGRHPEADVERAVALVLQHHTHGAPGLAEVRQALVGRWEQRKVARTDCHGSPAPQQLGYEHLTCLVEYGTGRVLRAFNERGDQIEPGSQRVIASAERVGQGIAPPAQLRLVAGGEA